MPSVGPMEAKFSPGDAVWYKVHGCQDWRAGTVTKLQGSKMVTLDNCHNRHLDQIRRRVVSNTEVSAPPLPRVLLDLPNDHDAQPAGQTSAAESEGWPNLNQGPVLEPQTSEARNPEPGPSQTVSGQPKPAKKGKGRGKRSADSQELRRSNRIRGLHPGYMQNV